MYYIDTCIWLNIIKNEEKFVESSSKLIDELLSRGIHIYISDVVLDELKSNLCNDYHFIEEFFKNESIKIVSSTISDGLLAEKLDSELFLGFGDCMHIAITRRLDLVLVTRDRNLLELGKNYVVVNSPEKIINLLSYV